MIEIKNSDESEKSHATEEDDERARPSTLKEEIETREPEESLRNALACSGSKAGRKNEEMETREASWSSKTGIGEGGGSGGGGGRGGEPKEETDI